MTSRSCITGICEDLLEWQIAQVDALARYMKPDFMTIAEDMSYNHGPMLSEELFNEFIKPYYQRLIPEIKKHGTRVFVDSDGDVTRRCRGSAEPALRASCPWSASPAWT